MNFIAGAEKLIRFIIKSLWVNSKIRKRKVYVNKYQNLEPKEKPPTETYQYLREKSYAVYICAYLIYQRILNVFAEKKILSTISLKILENIRASENTNNKIANDLTEKFTNQINFGSQTIQISLSKTDFVPDEIVNNHCEMVINQNSSYFEGHAKYEAVKDCLNYWRWFILYCGKEKFKILVKRTYKMDQFAARIKNDYQTTCTIVNILKKSNLLNSLLKTYEKEIEFRGFLHTDSGSDLIVETIKLENFEFIKNFIQEKYITSDIINLKNFWFSGKGENLYEYFMKIGQFGTLCAVIDWLSEGEPEGLQGFKERMLNRYKGLYLKNSIFKSNVDSDTDFLTSVNEFLLWSLETKQSISLFKRNINLCPNETETENMVSCYDELIIWILESKSDLIKSFFEWKDCLFYEKPFFLRDLIKDNNLIPKLISRARERKDFFSSFFDFLKKQLSLNDSDMRDLKGKIFESILNQNPYFSDFLRDWYANSRSADQLKSHIQSTGIKFPDYDTLCYLTSQDIVLNS
ncbi:hypothetical protein Avbf_18309 [Armadillidium vulgare]|nr:hypothetical protein Avbf_18309 [Armadillidium vulgare]